MEKTYAKWKDSVGKGISEDLTLTANLLQFSSTLAHKLVNI